MYVCKFILCLVDGHRFDVSWKKLQNYDTDLDSNLRPDRILIRVECKL